MRLIQQFQPRWNKKSWTKEEIFDAESLPLNMIVVKLNGGGLLLYAPVKVRVKGLTDTNETKYR